MIRWWYTLRCKELVSRSEKNHEPCSLRLLFGLLAVFLSMNYRLPSSEEWHRNRSGRSEYYLQTTWQDVNSCGLCVYDDICLMNVSSILIFRLLHLSGTSHFLFSYRLLFRHIFCSSLGHILNNVSNAVSGRDKVELSTIQSRHIMSVRLDRGEG
jgi:hypothetical protein